MILFVVAAVVAVLTGIAVISVRNSIHSALLLVVNLFCLAILYLTLNAELLAMLQIVVYAGAIMVLFIFVITLLNPGREETADRLPGQRWGALALGAALLVEIALLLQSRTVRASLGDFPAAVPFVQQVAALPDKSEDLQNAQAIGFELFTTYLLPFEAISILLLLAVIGAVVLAKRQRDPAARQPIVRRSVVRVEAPAPPVAAGAPESGRVAVLGEKE